MTIGLASAWRFMQPKRRKCARCGLYHEEKLPLCPHCGQLDDDGLHALLARQAGEQRGNAALGRMFLLIGSAVAVLLVLSLLA